MGLTSGTYQHTYLFVGLYLVRGILPLVVYVARAPGPTGVRNTCAYCGGACQSLWLDLLRACIPRLRAPAPQTTFFVCATLTTTANDYRIT